MLPVIADISKVNRKNNCVASRVRSLTIQRRSELVCSHLGRMLTRQKTSLDFHTKMQNRRDDGLKTPCVYCLITRAQCVEGGEAKQDKAHRVETIEPGHQEKKNKKKGEIKTLNAEQQKKTKP